MKRWSRRKYEYEKVVYKKGEYEEVAVFMIVLAAIPGGILLEWDNGRILA